MSGTIIEIPINADKLVVSAKVQIQPMAIMLLDTTIFCTEEEIAPYWYLIGGFQWVFSLGQFDIHSAYMLLSGFRSKPHLDRAKNVVINIMQSDQAAFWV